MKNSLQIAGGVTGAVVGFGATLLILGLVGFGSRADPIGSALLMLFVVPRPGRSLAWCSAPSSRCGCAEARRPADLAANSFKAFGTLIVLCAATGTAYYVYAVAIGHALAQP